MDLRIAHALHYIENNLNGQLRLGELSAIACLLLSQFHRIFKKEIGRTPFAYVEQKKMAEAYRQLCHSRVLVKELAWYLGYDDYETFSRGFKKHYGIAPDDLKAISLAVQKQLNPTEREEMRVLTFNQLTDTAGIIDNLRQTLIAEKWQYTNFADAKIFKIAAKELIPGQQQVLIKNKFVLTEDKTLGLALAKSMQCVY